MFLISLVVVLTQTHAHSQEWGRWFHGPTEFREYAAWVPELNKNELALLEVMCAADEAYVSVQFTSTSGQQRSGTANLQISGQTFSLPARYTDTDDAVAWRIRASADLVQALRSESRVRVSIDGETATFRLRGSSVAISKALEGCGQGRGYHKDWKNFYKFSVPDGSGTIQYLDVLPGAAQNGDAEAPTETSSVAELILLPADMPISPADLSGHIREACPSRAVLGQNAILYGDLDGDQATDIILNWGAVRCPNASTVSSRQGAGNCSTQDCRVDVYLSSIYQPDARTTSVWSHMENRPETRDNPGGIALRTFKSGASCDDLQVCHDDWIWNGVQLIAVR